MIKPFGSSSTSVFPPCRLRLLTMHHPAVMDSLSLFLKRHDISPGRSDLLALAPGALEDVAKMRSDLTGDPEFSFRTPTPACPSGPALCPGTDDDRIRDPMTFVTEDR